MDDLSHLCRKSSFAVPLRQQRSQVVPQTNDLDVLGQRLAIFAREDHEGASGFDVLSAL